MLEQLSDALNLIILATQINYRVLILIMAILWGSLLLNGLLHGFLFRFGILPRRLQGLSGILFAPFIHANSNHLFFNCIPLIVLANFILINGLHFFLILTLFITLVSGLLIWFLAKPGIYIGASAVITGYWAYLIANIQQGSTLSLLLALISIYYFAGIFLGIFPGQKSVSWQGHLFGLIAGVLAAFIWVQ